MNIKIKKRLSFMMVVTAIFVFLACAFPLGAYAEAGTGYNYVVNNKKSETKLEPIPVAYEYSKLLNSFGEEILKNPRDIYIDKNDVMYIADSGNNRIIKYNLKTQETTVFDNDGTGKSFSSPESVYVDDTGAIFVADTEAGRIVHLSSSGKFVEEFKKPESEILGESFNFNPRRIFVNNVGNFYMIQQDSLMTMDSISKFKGYIGETKVGFNIINYVYRLFASQELREQMGSIVRSSFLSMDYASDGYVYATINSTYGQIRKINTVGTNIYPNGYYGEKQYDDEGNELAPDFCDICVNDKGIISVLDGKLGRVYEYDQDGNNLCVFGSGASEGRGQIKLAVALDTDSQGNYYILDADQAIVLVYSPTEFSILPQLATQAYYNGEFDKVEEYSKELLEMCSSYRLSHYFMGKVAYKQKDYSKAMKEFKLADDREGYSKAYEKYRLNIMLDNFPIVVLIVIVSSTVILFLLFKLKKLAKKVMQKLIFKY